MGDPTVDQQAMTHICQVLELDSQAVAFLEAHRIGSVRRFTTTTVDRYEELANVLGSPLDNTDIDQINLFRTWYTRMIQKRDQFSSQGIIQELTEEVWNDFCNSYLIFVQEQQAQQAQAASSAPQTFPRQVQQVEHVPHLSSFRVSLKNYPIITGKASDTEEN